MEQVKEQEPSQIEERDQNVPEAPRKVFESPAQMTKIMRQYLMNNCGGIGNVPKEATFHVLDNCTFQVTAEQADSQSSSLLFLVSCEHKNQ